MKKKKFINHKEYINSKGWLLKKHELISIYLKQGWNICCNICGSESYLQVHHKNYKQFGNENLKDDGSGDIWNLEFLCSECHQRWHKDADFRQSVIKKRDDEFCDFLSNYKN